MSLPLAQVCYSPMILDFADLVQRFEEFVVRLLSLDHGYRPGQHGYSFIITLLATRLPNVSMPAL